MVGRSCIAFLVVASAVGTSASAEPPQASRTSRATGPARGTIVHATSGRLVARNADGTVRGTLATLPSQLGVVSRIDTSDAGQILMLVAARRVLRVDLTTTPASLSLVNCEGEATLSPDGRSIACARGRRGVDVYRFSPTRRRRHLTFGAHHVAFQGARSSELVAARHGALWALRGDKPRRKLAGHAPDGPWLVSPNGRRAVGVYRQSAQPLAAARASTGSPPSSLVTFRLDGKAIKRRLLRGAAPVAWSKDSAWILVQAGSAACIVRAVGGQYKCWKGFRAHALTPDGHHALMVRASEQTNRPTLYLGVLSGARPEPPRKIVESFEGAAAWRALTAPTARRSTP